MHDLEKEIDILEAKENKLDELIYNMKSQIKAITERDGEYPFNFDLKSTLLLYYINEREYISFCCCKVP